ncbi:hypothetical protein [Streptomyces decoyicus]
MTTAATKKTVARAAEATATDTEPAFVPVEYKGKTYQIAIGDDAPIEVLEAESDFDAVKAILGPEQWADFKSTKQTVGDYKRFSTLIFEAMGEDDSGN